MNDKFIKFEKFEFPLALFNGEPYFLLCQYEAKDEEQDRLIFCELTENREDSRVVVVKNKDTAIVDYFTFKENDSHELLSYINSTIKPRNDGKSFTSVSQILINEVAVKLMEGKVYSNINQSRIIKNEISDMESVVNRELYMFKMSEFNEEKLNDYIYSVKEVDIDDKEERSSYEIEIERTVN